MRVGSKEYYKHKLELHKGYLQDVQAIKDLGIDVIKEKIKRCEELLGIREKEENVKVLDLIQDNIK